MRNPKLALWIALALALALANGLIARSGARAQDTSNNPNQGPGRAPDALPGVRDLALVSSFGDGATVAGTFGYGYTEAVENIGDAHHRVQLIAAGSYALFDMVGFGMTLSGHYDQHVGGGSDGDSSFVLSTRFHGRARYALRPDLSFGGELAIELPPSSSPGDGLKAISPELRGLVTWTGNPRWVLGAQLGARLDRSAEGLSGAARLSGADRIALGASSSSALLFGLGGTYLAAPRHGVIGELTWDLLVGPDAPTAPHSPLRLVGGWRYSITDALALDAFLGVTPTARPNVAMSQPFVPVEPRVWLGVGLASFVGSLRSSRGTVTGRVVDQRGAALPNVRVSSEGKSSTTVTTDRAGRFSIDAKRGSRLSLRAELPLYVPVKRQAVLEGETLKLDDWQLVRGRGNVRGRVIGPELAPKASVVVAVFESAAGSTSGEEALAEAITSDDGTFLLEALPSGPLYLVASALGFRDAQVGVSVPVEQELQVELKLSEALPEGQIRGTVRGARGAQLAATIRVEPLGLVITAGSDGAFSLDVAPGSYQLLVTAPGYEPQQRVATVERDGVTVVLVDLLRQP